MGGRGASSGGGGASGGLNPGDIVSTTSLISARERQREEVDDTLTVLRDVSRDYGVIVNDVQLATLKGSMKSAMAYYDSGGNLAVNQSYFDSAKMTAAYDRCVGAGFHPSRGSRTAMEAVVAHEMGHRLTDMAAQRAGMGSWQLDRVSGQIVRNAAKARGVTVKQLASQVSGYAKTSHAECVAEAFADVYCNGGRARAASRAIVTELNKHF